MFDKRFVLFALLEIITSLTPEIGEPMQKSAYFTLLRSFDVIILTDVVFMQFNDFLV